MVPSDKTLARIDSLASKLNTETEALNKVIGALEKRLADARVGVNVWLGLVLDSTESVERQDAENDHGFVDVRHKEGWDLGYAKVGESWHIAAKKSLGIECGVDQFGGIEYDWGDVNEPVALIRAPRVVRVEAAKHLDRLLDAIGDRMEQFIDNIAQAKKLATNQDK